MAAKRKAAASAADQAAEQVRALFEHPVVQRLMHDADLRDNLRSAYGSSRTAYGRMRNGKGPAKAILDDKKVQKELRNAADSLRGAADSVRGAGQKRRGGKLRGLAVLVIGGGLAAVALNEGVRKKVLDTLFGAEEEFEYTSQTTPTPAASEPVGTAS